MPAPVLVVTNIKVFFNAKILTLMKLIYKLMNNCHVLEIDTYYKKNKTSKRQNKEV